MKSTARQKAEDQLRVRTYTWATFTTMLSRVPSCNTVEAVASRILFGPENKATKASPTRQPEDSRITRRQPKMDFRGMDEGDYFQGQYEVTNVVGSTPDKVTGFWARHTGCNMEAQPCGMKGCPWNAEVGGHMWIKGLSKFCVILPICKECNNKPIGPAGGPAGHFQGW